MSKLATAGSESPATIQRKAPGVPPELADRLVIMADVRERLACSRWTVYRLIEEGKLAKGKKIGQQITVTKKSLDAYIKSLSKGT